MTEYYLDIYPRYLWLELISEDSIKELNENYKTYDGDPLDESFIHNSDACTCLISTKDDKKCGCLILFNSDKSEIIKILIPCKNSINFTSQI